MDFEAGQRFLIRSDPREVRVKRTMRNLTVVEWPWGEADPASRYRWNGGVALPSDPTRLEWVQSPWRLEPRTGLDVGDTTSLFIPPSEVVVLSVTPFDPPRDVGTLPRPRLAVEFALVDETQDIDEALIEEASFTLYFDRPEPIEFTPLAC